MKKEIKLNSKLEKTLEDSGIVKFTEIQERAIPEILAGEKVLGVAQTGTGKTLAFALPILELLSREKSTKKARAVIIAPTRDLAIQIHETFEKYAKPLHLSARLFIGGKSVQRDVMICKKEKIDIVIANPGRLMDLAIDRKVLDLSDVKFVVLDEADQLLDMGFFPDIEKIYFKAIKKTVEQTLMFTATMPKKILILAEKFLGKNYLKIKIKSTENVFDKIEQKAYIIKAAHRIDALIYILKKYADSQAIVFTRTRREAKKLEDIFKVEKISATSIHSDKSQAQRTRIVQQFKTGKLHFLIATDVMARGIDVNNLPLVINYNLPDANETYIHRIGRTARAGAKGLAITLIIKSDLEKISKIEKLMNYKINIKDIDKTVLEAKVKYEVKGKTDSNFQNKKTSRSSRSSSKTRNRRKEENQDFIEKLHSRRSSDSKTFSRNNDNSEFKSRKSFKNNKSKKSSFSSGNKSKSKNNSKNSYYSSKDSSANEKRRNSNNFKK